MHAGIWEHICDDVASTIGFPHTRTSAKASCLSSIRQTILRSWLVDRSFKTAVASVSVSETATECLAGNKKLHGSLRAG